MTHDIDRDRYRRLFPDPPADPGAVGGAPAFVGIVTTATPAVGQFLKVTPVAVLGSEVEGGAPSFTSLSGSVPVLLIGGAAAVTGDYLVCHFVGHRWVAERMPTGGGTPPPPAHPLTGCYCTDTLHMDIPDALFLHVDTSADPHNLLFASPVTYGPKPAEYTTGFPLNGWWSGKFTSADTLYQYYYRFYCAGGDYALDGVYSNTSPLGYPGVFSINRWLIDGVSNLCTPFTLVSPDVSARHLKILTS